MKVPYDVVLPQVSVLGSTMAYREAGNPEAPIALFLHGNPTSSYIWRNIIPLVAPVAHCIAPDLIGFGQSGKPDIAYRFEDHVRYLDAFLAKMGISSAYLVAQDWGTGLAFHLAERRPDFVRGLAFMEFIRPIPTWEEFLRGSQAREMFRKFRTPVEGEKLILEGNAFVERVLPTGMRHKLSDEEIAVYRAPFPTPQSRRPTWRFPNEIPIAGEPADVYAMMEPRMQRSPPRPIRSSSSPQNPARLSRRPLRKNSLASSRIAGSSSSGTASIFCRRITPRRSGDRSPRSSLRSKVAPVRARLSATRRRRHREQRSDVAIQSRGAHYVPLDCFAIACPEGRASFDALRSL